MRAGATRSWQILHGFKEVGASSDLFSEVTNVAVFSIVTDLICTSLPVVIVSNIKITLKQKLAICGLMGLGLV